MSSSSRPGLVFISYKREEAPKAAPLREALVDQGFNVWWDEDLQCGQAWAEKLDEAVQDAACIIVLWSERSVASQWVRHEASQAIARKVYAPCRIELVQLDSPYDRIQATDLINWDGDREDGGFHNLIARVDTLVPAPVSPPRRMGRWLRANLATLVASGIAVLALLLLLTIFRAQQADRREKVYDCSASRELRAELAMDVYSNGESLRRVCLSSANLSGADLSGADLSGADLKAVNLIESDLTEAILNSADLASSILVRAKLNGGKLVAANLRWANLTEADLSGAHLELADLRDALLGGAKLPGARLGAADLTGVYLADADLSGASTTSEGLMHAEVARAFHQNPIWVKLRQALDRETNLSGADLSRADLTRADLRGADLSRAVLSGAILTEANLSGADLSGANLSETIVQGTDLRGSNLTNAKFEGACADKTPKGWPADRTPLPPCPSNEEAEGEHE